MTINGDEAGDLEALIGRHGLADVLATIVDICLKKAEHIRTNWEDQRLAQRWEKVAEKLEKITFRD